MNARPQPKVRSTLGGLHPAASSGGWGRPVAQEAADRAEVGQDVPVAAPAASGPQRAAGAATTVQTKFYQRAEDKERMLAAIAATHFQEGVSSVPTHWLNEVINREVARLEAEYGNRQPFPAVPVAGRHRGRPAGR
jgi:hypothetical protein